jgi:LuxR family maltose regulon positive regulatory protein
MLAFDAEDDDLILRTASRHAGILASRAQDILVRLQSIPRTRVVEHPLIAIAIAVCLAQDPRSRVAMLMSYARAERLARPGAPHGRAVDRVALHAARSVALMNLGLHSAGASAIRTAITMFEGLPVEEGSELIVSPAILYTHAAAVAMTRGDMRSARTFSARATGVPRASETVRRYSLTLSALMSAVDGDIEDARHGLAAAATRPGWRSARYMRALPGLTEAVLAVERGETSDARHIVSELVPHIWSSAQWPVTAAVLAAAEARDGRPAMAADRLRSALGFSGAVAMSTSDRRALETLLSLARLATGDLTGARRTAAGLGRSGGSFVARSTIALVAGDAVTAVMASSEGLTGRRTTRTRVSLLLVRAAAAVRMGRAVAAARDAESARGLLIATGTRLPWLLLPADDRRAVLELWRDAPAPVDDVILAELDALPVLFGALRPVARLTAREIAVLEGVTRRQTNVEIASRLGVSPNTVKKQRASLYRKLGARTWDEALGEALDRGLLGVEPDPDDDDADPLGLSAP